MLNVDMIAVYSSQKAFERDRIKENRKNEWEKLAEEIGLVGDLF